MAARQTGKIALVTGAADRLGASIAASLANSGFAVVIHYHSSQSAAERLAQTINAKGGRAKTLQADLRERSARATLIDDAAKLFGPLTVLVNNASMFEPDSVETLNEELWDAHFAVHTEAPLFLARDFAAQLPAGADGNIVNIIDERVWRLTPAYTSYSLSKSALWTGTITMAQSLAPRIRVNAIGPGPTLPHDRQTTQAFDASVAALPLQRGASPQEIADALLFLLNTPSMTGQMLALDGGEHLKWPVDRGPTPRLS